jgi:hypothetical protein
MARKRDVSRSWLRTGICRGVVLGGVYPLLIGVGVTVADPVHGGALPVVVVGVIVGPLLGAVGGFAVGIACALLDHAFPRRTISPGSSLVAALGIAVTAAATTPVLVAWPLGAWAVVIAAPAALGLVSLLVRPVLVNPSGATSVRTAAARCAGR